jgi:EAL domain-containing protein (putative c-di-GMP-specific phosphodiesterase class I)
MCHSLGYEVVAEGVENLIICNRLRDLGCDIIQGYFISRPLSQTDLIKWLHEQDWKAAASQRA